MKFSPIAISTRHQHGCRSGFTLVELLITIVIIAALAALSMSVLRRSIQKANTLQCASKMKNLGTAIVLFSQDHQGQFPRSFHSAGACGEPGWAISIAPYLGASQSDIDHSWDTVFNSQFRSPSDKSKDIYVYSYALNVHFELDPDGDDYQGAPKTWRRFEQVPAPEITILLAQPKPVRYGDHLMCHEWTSVQAAKNSLNYKIHDGKANYLFVDCHVETLRVEETFDPAKQRNQWNPSLAK